MAATPSHSVIELPVYELQPDLASRLDESPVSGQMTGHVDAESSHMNTLDEPLSATFLRDLRTVAAKFACVLWPRSNRSALLREWDLWGPLILCTLLAVVLRDGGYDVSASGGPEFAEVFVVVWLGSAVVTLNTKLLGGNVSFFQSVCVLGYCLLPSVLSLLLCRLLLLLIWGSLALMLRLVVTCAGFGWAVLAAVSFLAELHPPDRRTLGIYPIGLFYFIVSWMVLSHTGS